MAKATFINANAGVVAARMCGDSELMTRLCQPLVDAARGLAAAHVLTGSYESSFGVDRIRGRKGVTDRAVYNSDPQSHIIEDGHLQYGKDDNGELTVRFVDGLHILRRVARMRF